MSYIASNHHEELKPNEVELLAPAYSIRQSDHRS